MRLQDSSGRPYRRLPEATREEVDAYVDSLEYETARERVEMAKENEVMKAANAERNAYQPRLTEEEIVARAGKRDIAWTEARRSLLWFLVPAGIVFVLALWLFSKILDGLRGAWPQ